MPKKLKRGDPLGFFNIRSVEKLRRGGTLWENFFFEKKVSQSRKYSKGVEYPLAPLSFLNDTT